MLRSDGVKLTHMQGGEVLHMESASNAATQLQVREQRLDKHKHKYKHKQKYECDVSRAGTPTMSAPSAKRRSVQPTTIEHRRA
jgi:hypothetical protein